MFDSLAGWSWWQILLLGVALNLATLVTSAVGWAVLVRRSDLGLVTRHPTRSELLLAGTTTMVDGLALVPAWWLWRQGTLELAPSSPIGTVLGFVYLLVGVETAMYFLHRISHLEPLYGWVHGVHHQGDRRMHALSLFVMHPVEPAGFAFVVLVLLLVAPVPAAAVIGLFVVNLVVGTIAHLPRPQEPVGGWWDRWLGGALLHQSHHDHEDGDFGFFTQAWDRLLGTRS